MSITTRAAKRFFLGGQWVELPKVFGLVWRQHLCWNELLVRFWYLQ